METEYMNICNDAIKIEDTSECLVALSDYVDEEIRVDYHDNDNPVFKICGNELHAGDYVCKTEEGEIFFAYKSAIIKLE